MTPPAKKMIFVDFPPFSKSAKSIVMLVYTRTYYTILYYEYEYLRTVYKLYQGTTTFYIVLYSSMLIHTYIHIIHTMSIYVQAIVRYDHVRSIVESEQSQKIQQARRFFFFFLFFKNFKNFTLPRISISAFHMRHANLPHHTTPHHTTPLTLHKTNLKKLVLPPARPPFSTLTLPSQP
jgi:hypothetical protein